MQQYNKIGTAGYEKADTKTASASVDIQTGHKKRGHLDPFLQDFFPGAY